MYAARIILACVLDNCITLTSGEGMSKLLVTLKRGCGECKSFKYLLLMPQKRIHCIPGYSFSFLKCSSDSHLAFRLSKH